MAYFFKWDIKRINIYPFGGCVSFDETINRPILEEALILIAGPFVQVIYFTIITIIYKQGLISLRNYEIFRIYHHSLLFFNLLPIYPLDGGRLINLFFNYNFPLKIGNKLSIFLSFMLTIVLSLLLNNLNFYIMAIIINIELVNFYKNQDLIYNRFLLERYLYKYRFKKFKIIKNKDNMYKEKRNIIKEKDKYITEEEYLKKRFQR